MKKTLGEYLIETYGENAIELYWSEKNTLSPYDYTCGSDKKIWIKCQNTDYHEDYYLTCNKFTNNKRCPYCSGQKTHPKDSFAQWGIDNICQDFIEKYWSKENILNPYKVSSTSGKTVMIICQKNKHHDKYNVRVADFKKGVRCGMCNGKKTHKNDSVGEMFPKSITIYSNKNDVDIYKISPYSHNRFWWKCENKKHNDYYRECSISVKLDFRCPQCSLDRSGSFLQEKVRLCLNELKYTILHENQCSIVPKNPKNKYSLPFDNEVVELKLIIEVHGQQHYNEIRGESNWLKDLTPEQYLHKRKLYDRYKRFISHINGYHYLEIPYWEFDDDTYKQTILNKIELIRIKGE